MKITKAIEIKEIYYKGGKIPNHSDYREADMMSIKALKRVYDIRTGNTILRGEPLPGETEE